MIEFINVNKMYANNVKALQDINVKINQGEFVAIIGLSGAGKSTLIRCINGMHEITSGQLIVDELEVNSLKGKDIRKLRKRIGMIFQSFNLITRTSVLKNVLVSFVPQLSFWRKVTGFFTKEQKIKALTALDQVGILDKAYIRVDQLSGGQQQRVALARTLAQNPDIILADEPIASLDPVTSKQVMEDFKRINKEMDISVIMNIHHVEIALEYANRIIGIRAGKIVYDGKSENVTQEVLNHIYGDSVGDKESTEEGDLAYV
ncbi:phosphonate ABC transporter ATP-binding protein [Ornithinibacillus scapharcae]|uniref:phosphonate ABC transporter ATP-binding protein n=1 Tax=Ornithinibacillus scapharcae TaxID=1147159 RepID=UPI000225B824|nr:phosphonate ABC transporter ATP-binding protein [Ornithinibacillus scapharcae]